MSTKYEELIGVVTEKVNETGKKSGKITHAVSKTDHEAIMHTLMNTPGQTFNVYNGKVDDAGKAMFTVETPVKDYRNSLKGIASAAGMDAADTTCFESIPLSKEHAAAAVRLAGFALEGYLSTGRKYDFPTTSEDSTRRSVYFETAPERESENKFSKTPGDVTVTKERTIVRCKSTTPPHLKFKRT